MADIRLQFQYSRRGSNLEQWKHFCQYVIGHEFIVDLRKSFGQQANLRKIRSLIRGIVETEIYGKGGYSASEGTGNIKRSFETILGPGELEILAYSNPAIATAQGPFKKGGNPSDFSYAAFFERPVEFNSFLPMPENDPHHEIRYRPFMTPMVNAIYTTGHEAAVQAYVTILRRKMPQGRLGTP